ncbi:hypothetical protein [Kingella potus]|uniref:hypothetical protein n=1 Tax=Kingella potus TaxID=265175 RepID=UPI001FD100AA|nr:hypothetical protein [Kingella potus]UOP00894.1 hypothetical protein LVJ84_00205 [Kingella potus]
MAKISANKSVAQQKTRAPLRRHTLHDGSKAAKSERPSENCFMVFRRPFPALAELSVSLRSNKPSLRR